MHLHSWRLDRSRAIRLGASAAALAVIVLVREQRVGVAISLATFFLWAIILAIHTTGKTRDAFVLVVSLLVVPTALEIYFAARSSVPETELRYSARYYKADPVLGYGPVPAQSVRAHKFVTATGKSVYDVTYTIDEHGLRATASNPTGPTVAFFFDSFVFGEGVNDADTLPQAFADLTGRKFHVANFAFHGYGPQAFLRILETGSRDDLLRPGPTLFVVETALWHASRSACRSDFTWMTPRYELVDGAALYRGQCVGATGQFFLRQLNRSYLYTSLIHPLFADKQRDIDLDLAILRNAVSLADQKYHAHVVVLYLRSNPADLEGTNYTDEKVMELMRQDGAIVVDATLELSPGVYLTNYRSKSDLTIPGDGHPTPKANQLRAALLSDALMKANLMPANRD